MKIKSIQLACAALFAGLLSVAPLHAATIISEDWESFDVGDTPSSPWSVNSGNPSGTRGSATVVDTLASPFWGGDQSLHIQGTSGVGVLLTQTFAATTSALSIEFDFYRTSPGVLPTFMLLDSSNATGLQLNLHNSLSGHTDAIVNQTAGNGVGTAITSSPANTWVNVKITTQEATAALDTYSITVTPHGGESVTVSSLAFRTNLADFGGIRFAWNSTNGVGNLYVDNVVVTAIPEPATSALLATASVGLVVIMRRRKRA